MTDDPHIDGRLKTSCNWMMPLPTAIAALSLVSWIFQSVNDTYQIECPQEFDKFFNDIDARFDSFNQDCLKTATGSWL